MFVMAFLSVVENSIHNIIAWFLAVVNGNEYGYLGK